MIILSIDTSQSASVALVDTDTGAVIAAEAADDQRRHVEFIGPALARVLAAEARPELVITGIGPGPFTGLRVGIAAGIAVGQARGIPVRGVLSQAAIAEELLRTEFDPPVIGLGERSGASTPPGTSAPPAASSPHGASAPSGTSARPGTLVGHASEAGAHPVLIASDARRKEVYFSVYEATDASLSAGPFVAKPAELEAVLNANGYELDAVTERLGRGFLLYTDTLGAPSRETIVDPRAEFLAFAAARELENGRELREPVPEYLREPDAKTTPVRESTLK